MTAGNVVFNQHRLFFGHEPFNSGTSLTVPYPQMQNRREIANMEWLFFNIGRVQFKGTASFPPQQADATDLFAGRYGETNRLYAGISSRTGFPQPGVTGVDENRNQFFGQATKSGQRALVIRSICTERAVLLRDIVRSAWRIRGRPPKNRICGNRISPQPIPASGCSTSVTTPALNGPVPRRIRCRHECAYAA